MKKFAHYLKTFFLLIVRAISILIKKIDNFILKIGDRNPDFAKLWIIATTLYVFAWLLYIVNLVMMFLIFIKRDCSVPDWMFFWKNLNFPETYHPSFIGAVGLISSIYLFRIIYFLVKK